MYLTVREATKIYGSFTALNRVSLEIGTLKYGA